MFLHLFYYRIQTVLRNRSLLFWTLLFPIILGFFFTLAFGNLDTLGKVDPIKVGIVGENDETKQQLETVLSEIKNEGISLFKTKKLTQKAATEQLNANKIDGYYLVEEEIRLIVKERKIQQSILEETLNQYTQNSELMTQLISAGKLNANDLNDQIIVQENVVKEKTGTQSYSIKSFYIFTLIGMTIMYALMWGLTNANDQQANQSAKGIRLSLMPTSKLMVSVANLLASLSVFLVELLVILSVFNWIYQVDFGDHWGLILSVCVIGSLAAISFGTLLGNLFTKMTLAQKNNIGLTITMIMSFGAGMMGTESIKYWLDINLPLLSRLNFVNLISESLYQLYYYQSLSSFYINLIWLSTYAVIFILCNFYFERRIQYVSL